MDFDEFNRIDRATWRRYLFYVDLVVIGIFTVSLILIVRHTFLAGQLLERGDFRDHTTLMWQIVADTVFFVSTLCWILYRFFRNQYLVLTRRF